jgi:hypothetical protein
MASKELTREALVNLATPFLEAGKAVFIAYCPTGKVYVAPVMSEECRACKVAHQNHTVTSLADIPDPDEIIRIEAETDR